MKGGTMNVLLTGATGGIGAQTAALLATRGANLLLVARDASRLKALRSRLTRFGTTVEVVAADLATEEGRRRVAAAAHEFQGGINVLINNAGINRFDLFDRQSDKDLEAVVNINLLAPMLLTHKLLPLLQRQRMAVVLNVGSIVGSIGLPGQVAYCSSKFGMHGFSEALRRELDGSPIRVVYVAPRSTDTDMNDSLLREINELSRRQDRRHIGGCEARRGRDYRRTQRAIHRLARAPVRKDQRPVAGPGRPVFEKTTPLTQRLTND